jgi:hypothetical protein
MPNRTSGNVPRNLGSASGIIEVPNAATADDR